MEILNQLYEWLISFKYYVFAAVVAMFLIYIFQRIILARWYRHKNYPITLAITFLFAGFLSITTIWNSIVISFLEKLKDFSLIEEIIPPNEKYSLLAYLVFCITVGIILIAFYLRFSNKKLIHLESRNEGNNSIPLVKTPPPKIPIENPNFHERIKELFELKYKRLNLEYDSNERILYGFYKEGLSYVSLLIYCESTNSPKKVKPSEQRRILSKLDGFASDLNLKKSNGILNIYYLIEKGEFSKDSNKMICLTEDRLIDSLIDFQSYLEKVIYHFENDPLPFLSSNKNATLASTFIHSKFNDGKVGLSKELDHWLDESGNRQMVILGDYGTGKTSFLKFYNYRLAKRIIDKNKIQRIPIFISLTNTSPMHGGILEKCKSFVAEYLGIDFRLFEKLVHKGKVLFLLDGFDEMGFIGTREQRFKQLDAIWQLATQNNKIIITGRPSYFPNEFDLSNSLNIKNELEQKMPQVFPYSEKIVLDFFHSDQIKNSVLKTYPDRFDYIDFIFSNKSILDLCKRPSLLHIVKEMLPELKESQTNQISATTLIKLYVDHWIDRQLSKNIKGVIENKIERRKLVFDFFTNIAGKYYNYESGNIKLTPGQIYQEIENHLAISGIRNNFSNEEKEGLYSELISGYFLERIGNEYKFVHKSFFEFFVSNKIIALIRLKKFNDSLIYKKEWTLEIIDFVYSAFEYDERIDKKIPILPQIAKGENKFQKFQQKYFKVVCSFFLFLNSGKIWFLGLFFFLSVNFLSIFDGYHWLMKSILSGFVFGLCAGLNSIKTDSKVRIKKSISEFRENNSDLDLKTFLNIFLVLVIVPSLFLWMFLNTFFEGFIKVSVFWGIFIFVGFFSSYVLSKLSFSFLSKPIIKFNAKSNYIEMNMNHEYLNTNSKLFLAMIKIFGKNRFRLVNTKLSIPNDKLELHDSIISNTSIDVKSLEVSMSSMNNVILVLSKGSNKISICDTDLKNVKFEGIATRVIHFENISEGQIDEKSLDFLKDSLRGNTHRKINFKNCDWLEGELRDLSVIKGIKRRYPHRNIKNYRRK